MRSRPHLTSRPSGPPLLLPCTNLPHIPIHIPIHHYHFHYRTPDSSVVRPRLTNHEVACPPPQTSPPQHPQNRITKPPPPKSQPWLPKPSQSSSYPDPDLVARIEPELLPLHFQLPAPRYFVPTRVSNLRVRYPSGLTITYLVFRPQIADCRLQTFPLFHAA